MKRTTLLMFLLCSGSFALQQEPTGPQKSESPQNQREADRQQSADDSIKLMRQDIRSQRKQIVAANLPLTEAESTKFWPVYDRYVIDHSKVYDTRYSLIEEYAKNYSTLTENQAHNFIKRWTTTEEQMAQLRLRWIPQFEKVISAKKTAMFFQIDRRLGLLVELKLSSEIPLAEP
jgi:hypothetical protein